MVSKHGNQEQYQIVAPAARDSDAAAASWAAWATAAAVAAAAVMVVVAAAAATAAAAAEVAEVETEVAVGTAAVGALGETPCQASPSRRGSVYTPSL